jgi:hypothetical protein
MWELIIILGLVGFAGGVIAIIAIFAQRDANKQKEEAAKQKGNHNDAT